MISNRTHALSAVFTLLYGYIGQFMHNGRILSISAFFMGCGSLSMLTPHFLYGIYEPGLQPAEFCDVAGACHVPQSCCCVCDLYVQVR